jgi:hypothetical protein
MAHLGRVPPSAKHPDKSTGPSLVPRKAKKKYDSAKTRKPGRLNSQATKLSAAAYGLRPIHCARRPPASYDQRRNLHKNGRIEQITTEQKISVTIAKRRALGFFGNKTVFVDDLAPGRIEGVIGKILELFPDRARPYVPSGTYNHLQTRRFAATRLHVRKTRTCRGAQLSWVVLAGPMERPASKSVHK